MPDAPDEMDPLARAHYEQADADEADGLDRFAAISRALARRIEDPALWESGDDVLPPVRWTAPE